MSTYAVGGFLLSHQCRNAMNASKAIQNTVSGHSDEANIKLECFDLFLNFSEQGRQLERKGIKD